MSLDISRLSTGVSLPATLAAEIQQEALATNPFFTLATEEQMPGAGVEFQSITGDATAAWVAETDAKPVSSGSFSTKTITPAKVAVIVPFSMEFKRDASKLYEAFAARIPSALTAKIVATIAASSGAPNASFTQLGGLTGKPVGGVGNSVYSQLLDAEEAVSTGGKYVANGYALNPAGRFALLRAVDGNGRPLLAEGLQTSGAVTNVLGNPTSISKDVTGPSGTLGYVADWSQFHYGVVDGIQVTSSDAATLTIGGNQVNLFERNMFAIRAEVEVAFWGPTAAAARLVVGADVEA